MERALVERARSGDRAAFDALVRSRIDAVYRTSLAILGKQADAADATQETFVSAWCHRDALRDPDLFDAWLGRINLNACRAQLRRRGRTSVREIRLLDPEDGREPASTERRWTTERPTPTSSIEPSPGCRSTTRRPRPPPPPGASRRRDRGRAGRARRNDQVPTPPRPRGPRVGAREGVAMNGQLPPIDPT
jgi:RNA polymerase sigma-70 factor (ECF subfamily)